ncbi:plasmid mobilization protein [Lactococcus lactis]|uniref:plasmid mobilization protein n=1 Tax=Lactococcus lactis TaxID=1358 RepID=UPI001D18FD03|nr:plasmid mobilization relaxosome protein MobC [Lactococcus lactis]MCC4121678.1 MobC family plasmid mobilization relaxosome protein [Lactococcus lactis]
MTKEKSVRQNQDQFIQFRISKEQHDKLKTSAKTYGLSANLYVKKLALKSHLKKPYFEHEQAKELLLELTRQGTNLNQIAKQLNQLDRLEGNNQELKEALRYTYGVLDQTQKGYRDLWQQLQK